MRLIDAEKLEEALVGEPPYLYVTESFIKAMPTVEAIPIEWLKEFYKNTSVSIPVGVPMIKILEELESAYKRMEKRR